eukprot:m.23935 g.23935  ORF g.23935 m.23935 type:complete len:497 (-) comp3950_c0_seq2:77-1567(-)
MELLDVVVAPRLCPLDLERVAVVAIFLASEKGREGLVVGRCLGARGVCGGRRGRQRGGRALVLLPAASIGALALEVLEVHVPVLKARTVKLVELAEESLKPNHVDDTTVRQVRVQRRQHLAVRPPDDREDVLADVEVGQVWQEIVADEKAEQDPVVKQALAVERERQLVLEILELLEQVVPHQGQRQQDKPDRRGRLLERLAAEGDLLAQQAEVRLVRRQAQHNQVGIEAVEAVAREGVVVGPLLLRADEVHDLVLALAGHLVAGEDDTDALPVLIVGHLAVQEALQLLLQAHHELRARGDRVGVKLALCGNTLGLQLFRLQRCLLRRAEAARALLVHLCTRRNAIDGHVQQPLRADDGDEVLQVRKHALEDHLLGKDDRGIDIAGVRALVNDAVHVQVEIIKLRDLVAVHCLAQARIALAHPSEELRDAHCGCSHRRRSEGPDEVFRGGYSRTLSTGVLCVQDAPTIAPTVCELAPGGRGAAGTGYWSPGTWVGT